MNIRLLRNDAGFELSLLKLFQIIACDQLFFLRKQTQRDFELFIENGKNKRVLFKKCSNLVDSKEDFRYMKLLEFFGLKAKHVFKVAWYMENESLLI